jgi:curved DNA-binding protein CbpA
MNFENTDPFAKTASTQSNSSFRSPTHYDVLNLDPSATRMAIRESYLRLKNLYSSNGDGLYGMAGPDDLARHMQSLDKAFDILNDDAARTAYNHRLASGETAQLENEWSSEVDQWKPVNLGIGSEIIQTSRSTLKVTRTRANGANSQELQAKFQVMMDEGDIADGSMLAALRELSCVTQAEMHERTKIPLEYIAGIENNRFEPLPKVVYIKGFMRSYLRYLNVPNLEKIVSAYSSRLEAWQSGQK